MRANTACTRSPTEYVGAVVVGLPLRGVRVFKQFVWLEVASTKMALSSPAYQPVTPAASNANRWAAEYQRHKGNNMANMNVNYASKTWSVDIPDKCPVCHHLIVIQETPAIGTFKKFAEIVFRCPNPDCRRLFMGYYQLNPNQTTTLIRFTPQEPTPDEIPAFVQELSPDFVEIYKQAKEAKEGGLMQICGPGYRKAFEFLIKDYAKSKAQDEATRNSIETTFAGTVVNNYIGDIRVQAVAKRALWLGNDETHYLRKWTTLNVDDLIALIRLTIHWIEIEQLSAKYVNDMTEGTENKNAA